MHAVEPKLTRQYTAMKRHETPRTGAPREVPEAVAQYGTQAGDKHGRQVGEMPLSHHVAGEQGDDFAWDGKAGVIEHDADKNGEIAELVKPGKNQRLHSRRFQQQKRTTRWVKFPSRLLIGVCQACGVAARIQMYRQISDSPANSKNVAAPPYSMLSIKSLVLKSNNSTVIWQAIIFTSAS